MKLRQLMKALATVVTSLLIAWALLFLAEHAGWSLVREAGGRVI